MTALTVSRKIVKSYRFIFAVPMAETARSILYNLTKAHEFYPSSEGNVEARKHYLTLAIADCQQITHDLECLLAMPAKPKASELEDLIAMIDREVGLIKGARKGVKLVSNGVKARRVAP